MSIDGPAGGRGKWSMAGIPHKGWTCDNVEDLGDDRQQCEMCESVEIRFVHYMSNPRYPDVLGCGEVCAGNMEDNLAEATKRDKKMRSVASRRKAFPARKSWYRNQKGNWQIVDKGFRVTMFQKGQYWRGVVAKARGMGNGTFTRDRFTDLNQAKMAAFDTLTFLQDREPPARPFNPADYFY